MKIKQRIAKDRAVLLKITAFLETVSCPWKPTSSYYSAILIQFCFTEHTLGHSQVSMEKLEALEMCSMWCYMRILRISWVVPNNEEWGRNAKLLQQLKNVSLNTFKRMTSEDKDEGETPGFIGGMIWKTLYLDHFLCFFRWRRIGAVIIRSVEIQMTFRLGCRNDSYTFFKNVPFICVVNFSNHLWVRVWSFRKLLYFVVKEHSLHLNVGTSPKHLWMRVCCFKWFLISVV